MRYILVFALAASLAAQEKVAETIEVRVANVDVVVTDRTGHPVHGLTKDDFEILENGKPQTITNFYEVGSAPSLPLTVSTPSSGGQTPPPVPQTTAAATAPTDVRARRFMVVLDNYSLEPIQRNSVITALRKFIDANMKPNDEVSLISWAQQIDILTPLTSNKADVLRALDAAMARSRAGMSAGQEDERARQQCRDLMLDVDEKDPDAPQTPGVSSGGHSSVTYRWEDAYIACEGGIQAFADSQWAKAKSLLIDMKSIVSRFAGVDGRKVLVLAGASLPEHPGRQAYMWLYQQFQPYQKFIKKTQINPTKAFGQSGSRSQTFSIDDLAHSANANGVTFYMIDAADTRDSMSAEKRGLPDERTNANAENFMQFTDTASAYHTLAAITGGAALSNTQNFDAAFQILDRDLTSFYSLGYKLSADAQGERSITVRVKKQGLYARSRTSLTPKNADDEMNDRVIANVLHQGVKGEWSVHLSAQEPQKNGDRFNVPVTVELDPKITLLPQDQKLVGAFTLYIVVGTKEGAMSKVTKVARKIEVPAAGEADFRSKPMKYTLALSVRPGDNIISVGVADQVSNINGFDRVDVAAK
jgi:VWFA-related protein